MLKMIAMFFLSSTFEILIIACCALLRPSGYEGTVAHLYIW